MSTPYTEDVLVQQTTAEYLEKKLGWESAYAYNTETFGARGSLGRDSDKEVVLKRSLRAALERLNPGLPEEAYAGALRQLVSVNASQSLLAANREKYQLLRDGVQVSFGKADGERVKQRLRIVDFANADNNHFLCVRELWVRGDLYRRRADIVCFVNGLPVVFMELKNVCKNIRSAFEQNYKDYKDTIPHLFHHNALVILANGVDAKLGSISSRFEHFHEWKRLDEDAEGVVDMETLLKGVCDKSNLLDLLENFILFDDSAGETRKIVARNHQFWASTVPLPPCGTERAATASSAYSGIPKGRAKAIPSFFSPARCIVPWEAILRLSCLPTVMTWTTSSIKLSPGAA